MATNGMLIAVRWEWDGTELVNDALAGAVVINVVDPFSLSIEELVWVSETGPYLIDDINEDTGDITLHTGLSEDADAASDVVPDVGGSPAQVWVAEVVVPDTEEPIEVPLTVHDLAVMQEGEYDPPVAIIITDSLDGVIDLPGNLPVINGGFVPPDTLPPVDGGGGSDGQVPPSSPQPDAVGGIGAFFLRWTPPPNNDPMRFEVHVSDSSGFAPSAATKYTETSAYSATLRNLPWLDTQTGELAKFQYGKDYFFRIVAKDADGSAGPSLEDFAQMLQVTGPDIAARNIAGEHIIGGTITGDLFAGSVILGSTISTGSLDQNGNISGARIDLGPLGLGIYDAAGNLTTRFPIDPEEDAFVQAHFHMFSAEVDNNFTLHGVNNAIAASSKLTLSNGIQAPTTPPNVGFTYDTVQLDTHTAFTGTGAWPLGTFALDASQIKNIAWVTDAVNGNYWAVVQEKNSGFRVWRFKADGTFKLNFTGQPWHDDFKGFTNASVASNGQVMMWTGADWILFGGGRIPPSWIINSSQDPYLAWDPAAGSAGQYMLCQSPTGATPKTAQIRRFTMDGNGNAVNASVSTLPSTVGRNTRFNAVFYGVADFGNTRYVTTQEGSDAVLVCTTSTRYNTNGNYQEWREPVASNGLGWDGTNFWSVDSNGKMTKYTGWQWPEYPTTTYVGMSAYDSRPAGDQANPWPGQAAGTHETPVGLLASTSASRRSKMVITVPVTNDSGGNDDQDKWKVYWSRTTGAAPTAAQMHLVSTLGSAAAPQSVTLLADPTGAAPPGGIGGQAGSGNNFPAGNPARLVSSALDGLGLPMIDLRGDGAGRMGPFKWDSAGKDLVKNGLVASYASANANNIANTTFVVVPGWIVDPWCTAPEFITSLSGGHFVFAVPGVYHIVARGTISSSSAANHRRIAALFRNDVEMARTDTTSAVEGNQPATIGVDLVMRIAAGDDVNLRLWQNTGGGIPFGAVPGHDMQIIKLSD